MIALSHLQRGLKKVSDLEAVNAGVFPRCLQGLGLPPVKESVQAERAEQDKPYEMSTLWCFLVTSVEH